MKIKIKLIKFFYKLYMKSNLYSYKSKLYRFLFQRKYKNVKINTFSDLKDLDLELSKLKYKKDSLKELGDAVSSPNFVQHLLNQVNSGLPQPNVANDCDDFAQYAFSAFENQYFEKELLSVIYYKSYYGWIDGIIPISTKKLTGHMVAIFFDKENGEYYHLGNWGMHGPYGNIKDLIFSICDYSDYIAHSFVNGKTLKTIDVFTDENLDKFSRRP